MRRKWVPNFIGSDPALDAAGLLSESSRLPSFQTSWSRMYRFLNRIHAAKPQAKATVCREAPH